MLIRLSPPTKAGQAEPKRTVTLNSFQGLLLDCEIPDQVRNDNKDGVRNDNEEWVQSARVPAYGGRDRRRWAAGHRLWRDRPE